MVIEKTTDLTDMDEMLRTDIDSKGIDYFAPQLNIIRRARNLPKNLEDERFATAKFYESLGLIEQWLSPLSNIFTFAGLDDKHLVLQRLQSSAAFRIREENIASWQQVLLDSETQFLFNEIKTLRFEIEGQRSTLLRTCNRANITTMLGLILYPFTYRKTLGEAEETAKNFFGPNVQYKKKNKYTDALIFMLAAEETFRHASLERILANPTSEEMWDVKRAYDEAKGAQYKSSAGFSTKQLDFLAERFLGRRLSIMERDEIAPAYLYESDRYRPDIVLDWFSKQMKTQEKAAARTESVGTGIVSQRFGAKSKKRHLFGLSFMDKHKRDSVLGNVPETSFELFEFILGPFHELKQDAIFMQTAQFSIECLGLPEQAWIYDYTGIKTEILRLTMLLISERQPKFDLLEACQRLASSVLSGRVDRDDVRLGNYIATEKLPRETWEHIGTTMVEILEEALIHEESKAQRIIREIFADEDRSGLVTSKKFSPAFQVEIFYQPRTQSPGEITIHSAEDFDFQYRHVLASGFPWYEMINKSLERLVEDSFNVSYSQRSSLAGHVLLRQVVFDIGDETFIYFYQPFDDRLSVLAFRERDPLSREEHGPEPINPVEVIFRPRKFLDRGPKRNNLDLILERALATDAKDLAVVISNL
ncbi:MAG: hypothetical protein ACXAEL_09055 [Candidatus Hodarchaeales archaeon]|jgi:hypothetical protein